MDILHISRPRHIGDLVAYEADLNYCRDSGTLDSSAARLVLFREVVGQMLVGTLSGVFAALGTNTGNPTCGTITVAAGTPAGEYDLVMTDATHFTVFNPHGTGGGMGEEVGHGVFGSAFSTGGLGFTITAGGAACVDGDAFKVTVSAVAGSGNWLPVNPSGTDGTQNAKGIVLKDADAASGSVPVELLTRGPMIVRAAELIWPAGATTNQIAAWTAQLQALNPPIKVVISG